MDADKLNSVVDSLGNQNDFFGVNSHLGINIVNLELVSDDFVISTDACDYEVPFDYLDAVDALFYLFPRGVWVFILLLHLSGIKTGLELIQVEPNCPLRTEKHQPWTYV